MQASSVAPVGAADSDSFGQAVDELAATTAEQQEEEELDQDDTDIAEQDDADTVQPAVLRQPRIRNTLKTFSLGLLVGIILMGMNWLTSQSNAGPSPQAPAPAPAVGTAQKPVPVQAAGTAQAAAPTQRPPDEKDYWHDDRVFEEVSQYYGEIGKIREFAIQFREKLPKGITMWSERGQSHNGYRSVDIHFESSCAQRLDMSDIANEFSVEARRLGGCFLGREIGCPLRLKQPESMSGYIAHPPGAFLTR
jgi:hypothetical protein